MTEIKGLKYPDEYFIKFFFKQALHTKKSLTFLELGCSNGCNMMLPYEYGHEVIGVDFDPTLIGYANENFSALHKESAYEFHHRDMILFCQEQKDIQADVLLMPSSIYYIPKDTFITLLENIKKNALIKESIPFFIRFREVDDYRNHKGKKVEENAYILQNGVTGEDGAYCHFYDTQEMIEILQTKLSLREFQTMKIVHDNIQNDTFVTNSDVVIWGTIN